MSTDLEHHAFQVRLGELEGLDVLRVDRAHGDPLEAVGLAHGG